MTIEKTRCKMQLEGVFAQSWGGVKAIFRCVYNNEHTAEDVEFSKATPSGHAEFIIDNPVVFPFLIVGSYYYIDITQVPNVPKDAVAAD